MPPEAPPTPPGQGRRLAAELLRAGVTVRVTVSGTSMGPALPAGRQVELEPLAGPPRVGDVIYMDVPGAGQLLHRVVRYRPGGRVQTRGDLRWRLDAPVDPEQVLGRVRRVCRPGERWRARAPAPLRWLLARGLLGGSMALSAVRRTRAALGARAITTSG